MTHPVLIKDSALSLPGVFHSAEQVKGAPGEKGRGWDCTWRGPGGREGGRRKQEGEEEGQEGELLLHGGRDHARHQEMEGRASSGGGQRAGDWCPEPQALAAQKRGCRIAGEGHCGCHSLGDMLKDTG